MCEEPYWDTNSTVAVVWRRCCSGRLQLSVGSNDYDSPEHLRSKVSQHARGFFFFSSVQITVGVASVPVVGRLVSETFDWKTMTCWCHFQNVRDFPQESGVYPLGRPFVSLNKIKWHRAFSRFEKVFRKNKGAQGGGVSQEAKTPFFKSERSTLCFIIKGQRWNIVVAVNTVSCCKGSRWLVINEQRKCKKIFFSINSWLQTRWTALSHLSCDYFPTEPLKRHQKKIYFYNTLGHLFIE